MSTSRSSPIPRSVVGGALLILLVAACNAPPPPSGTPAAPFAGVDGTARSALLAYAHGLSFDTARGAGDEQRLPVRDSGRVIPGPMVRIEPERGAAYLTRTELAQGRIISRFRAQGAYALLGIPDGTSYMWADSTGGQFRQVIIPENPNDTLRRFPMGIDSHPPEYYGPHPVYGSRWIIMGVWGDSLGCNTPCVFGCCRCQMKSALFDQSVK